MMKNYSNMIEAINDLKLRGYVNDFNLKPFCAECESLQLQLYPEEFCINEVYRFENSSDPGDNYVLYAIESGKGIRGILIDSYGVYAEAMSNEMAIKINNARNASK